MQEIQYKHNMELLIKATIEKNYDLVKEYLTPDYKGLFTEMYISRLLDGNGFNTLRTISRDDKGVDIIVYEGSSYNYNIYQVKNNATRVSAGSIKKDYKKALNQEEFINKTYNYISINGFSQKAIKTLKKETNIKLHDFNFIKELIDGYNPLVEQGSISEDEFISIYKKAAEKYLYNHCEINFDKERELLIKAYDERSIKIEYIRALEDLRNNIENKDNLKYPRRSATYDKMWLNKFKQILNPRNKDIFKNHNFNCNSESPWIRDQIEAYSKGTLNELRRKKLDTVPFMKTFISYYYKIKR